MMYTLLLPACYEIIDHIVFKLASLKFKRVKYQPPKIIRLTPDNRLRDIFIDFVQYVSLDCLMRGVSFITKAISQNKKNSWELFEKNLVNRIKKNNSFKDLGIRFSRSICITLWR